MIPKYFLLAFLSLKSSNPQSPNGDAAVGVTARKGMLNEPATPFHDAATGTKKTGNGIEYINSPQVEITGGDYQVPIQISSGQDVDLQRGFSEINFNNVPLGSFDPSEVTFPDNFKLLSQAHSYDLKDAFPSIPHPPGISRVWGPVSSSGRFAVSFGDGLGRARNVSIEFGWIEKGDLSPGIYTSKILTLHAHGWTIQSGPSGGFNGYWWDTTTNIEAIGDRFEFDFSCGSDRILLVSRVFYDVR